MALPISWQPVTQTPLAQGNLLVLYYSLDAQSRFFQLQPVNNCVFQASPSTIQPGSSSLLSWCPAPGTSYQLTPGPGPVNGSNYVVSPTVTTTYTLLASNVSGVSSSFATVTVGSPACGFAKATNWVCTLAFSYEWTPSSAEYSFTIRQEAHLSFSLTPSSTPGVAEFAGYVTGNAQVNDLLDDMTSMPVQTTTFVGSGAPQRDTTQPRVSQFTLDIDCTTGTYSFVISPTINATITSPSSTVPGLYPVGTVTVSHRALPVTVSAISSTGFLAAHGPLWTGGGDYYHPGGLGDEMFFFGVVNDNTAGSASVTWSLVPQL
jgi:hypothetical protein